MAKDFSLYNLLFINKLYENETKYVENEIYSVKKEFVKDMDKEIHLDLSQIFQEEVSAKEKITNSNITDVELYFFKKYSNILINAKIEITEICKSKKLKQKDIINVEEMEEYYLQKINRNLKALKNDNNFSINDIAETDHYLFGVISIFPLAYIENLYDAVSQKNLKQQVEAIYRKYLIKIVALNKVLYDKNFLLFKNSAMYIAKYALDKNIMFYVCGIE